MKLDLAGLTPAPAQVWGNVRLVPLLRPTPITSIRMALRDYSDQQWIATTRVDARSHYAAYVPHGLVIQWTPDGEPLAAVDTRLGAREVRKPGAVVTLDKMARGLGRNALRLLPLHLAMEGYLALHFGGPDTAQQFWSKLVRRHGLSPRTEWITRGNELPGLEEALRLFERHPDQCGVLVFVGDHLASATVVGHPEDYRALHDALITDFYGNLFSQWGWPFRDVSPFEVQLEGRTLAEIRASLAAAREDLGRWTLEMASGLLGRDLQSEVVRKAGDHRLLRFRTGFDRSRVMVDGEHIGEVLVDADGAVVYLKTYRLDRGQVRRGYLLSELARVGWDLERLATEQGHGSIARSIGDLDAAGLGFMVRADWRTRP